MKHQLHHLAILVEDLDASLASFSPFDTSPERHLLEQAGLEIGVVRIGGVELHLIRPLRPDSPVAKLLKERGPFVHHVGVEVASIQEEMERLRKEGMPPKGEPQRTAPGLLEVFIDFPGASGVEVQLVEDRREGETRLLDGGVADAVNSVMEERS